MNSAFLEMSRVQGTPLPGLWKEKSILYSECVSLQGVL